MIVKDKENAGFALVIALSLMAFILLLLLSMTTLVRVESRAAEVNSQQIEAEQNALLGLQQAIGELQKSMGPDQRISATADVLPNTDSSRRKLTGVWVSEPDNSSFAEGELLRWLVSDAAEDVAHNTVPAPSTTNAIILVGVGSLADTNQDGVPDDENEQISVTPTEIESGNPAGSYAWWVGDEGVKARIDLTDATQDPSLQPIERKLASRQTLSSSARSIVSILDGLSSVDLQTDDFASKLGETNDLLFEESSPSEAAVKAQFHNVTTFSNGVLADVRNGGLKEDLSLAFELSDTDFDNSAFGAGGADTITSPGFGQVQPIFRLENRTGIKANGPTWHLLRDYYTIYQRMQSPLTNPTLDAQALVPNHKELNTIPFSGVPSDYDWGNLPALRYIAGGENTPRDTISDGSQGDPLRSNGGELSIPVKANYLPYIQRHLTAIGLVFEDAPPPAGYSNTNNYEFRRLRQVITPSFVVHNPYNVTLRHNGMATAIDHIRFRIDIESELDPFFDAAGVSVPNWHMMKIAPGTVGPGEVIVYEGVQDGTNNFSQPGPANGFWQTSGIGDELIIPVDPTAPGAPNLNVSYRPFSNVRWAYWMYNGIAVPGLDSPLAGNLERTDVRSNNFVSNYGGQHADNIFIEYSDWYGGEDIGRTISTEGYRIEDDASPFPFLNYDFFLKPAEADFAYPGLTHTNPLAPIIQSRNLFATSRSKPTYGWPVYGPNWQLQIYTTGSAPGIDTLQTSGSNAYWGSANDASGSTQVAAIELPTSPLVSLAQLQNANIALYSHMPALAIGNAFASPFIPVTETHDIFQNRAGNDRILYDLSYLANEALWDRYFFSSYSRAYDANADQYNGTLGDSFDLAFDPEDYNGGSNLKSLPNPRMELSTERESISEIRNKLFEASGDPREDAYQRAAENLLVKGSFNIHSTSIDAWAVILTSARDMAIYQSGETNATNYTNNRTPLTRILQPTKGAFDSGSDNYDDDRAWGGFATLSDQQLNDLANAIVAEIKLRIANRGTIFTSFSAFVNRSLSNDEFGRVGLLQAAIDKSGINSAFTQATVTVENTELLGSSGDFPEPENIRDGDGNGRSSATSATAHVTQGDLLQAIGSFASVRSDTFRIRSYGASQDPISGDTISRAWCEAIVQRVPEPVSPGTLDPGDADYWESTRGDDFGRKFKIIFFRWLSEDEV